MFDVKKTNVFIIAEVGSNHGGSIEYAKKLARLASESGANAVKFQTFSADNLVNRKLSPKRHAHFDRLGLSTSEFIELAEYCKTINIEFMTSVWDSASLRILDPYLRVNKLGSGDLTNYQLIRAVVETNKPLIISTAMSSIDEVQSTIDYINEIDNQFIKSGRLCIMHCVAMYGAPLARYANFGKLDRLRSKFGDIEIGYSDHVTGCSAVLHALSLGVKVIEVHFTDNKDQEFRDHHLSVTPAEMEQIVLHANEITQYYEITNADIVTEIETADRIEEFRRAVYLRRDMRKGEVVSESDLIVLRPNIGLPANLYHTLIGKTLTRDIVQLEPIKLDYFV